MKYTYRTKGTCSAEIIIELDDNSIVRHVEYLGGCNGNLKGISKLVEGLPATEVIDRLKGIRCGMKSTSCPDQLARALELMLKEEK
ncbi:MAG: TIGR03905 family TSCPD domain-containing protein [Clostridia bacterium]|jgi:uncharacterized protein (TIGR03905 family)|nr:TIGR03905 family TSCPD domain-containing protein [Clostridia bacterium]MBR5785888.1 TIGR03905 family TSCPD domain-containing protein [Clostridia bacterium]